jgi:glycosyltransferase involved in cell wall biosynthesis
MEILVSVCITAYNLEAYLSQAIESVLMQETNFPFEIIIGDDASVDKTREICLSYKEKYPDKIKLVLHEKNVGVAKNDISVVKQARGKYIAWCDGDDYWITKDKLQKQYDVLEENSDVSLVVTDWIDYFEETQVYREQKNIQSELEKTSYGKECIKLLVQRKTIGLRYSSCMFRKSYYLDALLKDPDLFLCGHLCNDTAVFFAMYERGRFFLIPEFTTVYRIRPGSLSIIADREKRFIYDMGYLRLIVHVISYYHLDDETKNTTIRRLLEVPLLYTFNHEKPVEVKEIKEIAKKMNYKFSISQQFLYWGSCNRFLAFFLNPLFFIIFKKYRGVYESFRKK